MTDIYVDLFCESNFDHNFCTFLSANGTTTDKFFLKKQDTKGLFFTFYVHLVDVEDLLSAKSDKMPKKPPLYTKGSLL